MVVFCGLKRRRFANVNGYFAIFTCIIVAYHLGAFTYPFTLNYDSSFTYPLEWDIVNCAKTASEGKFSYCPIINKYDYKFLENQAHKCVSETNTIRLVLIIKSAIHNSHHRRVIRLTWGNENRFSDVKIKRIFVVGRLENMELDKTLLKDEMEEWGDIVMFDFIDTYFNTTIKTMLAFKWAVTYCANSSFYLFSDDDMYISVKNILNFIRNPTQYPQYLNVSEDLAVARFRRRGQNYDLPKDVTLFSGFVKQSIPHRHKCSKWYVSLHEYPYNKWPPYVSGGSYILSRKALVSLYYGSFFTQHFRFDDIYVGLVAHKMNIEPYHSDHFHIFTKITNKKDYQFALSSHKYTPDELWQVWTEQKNLGNA